MRRASLLFLIVVLAPASAGAQGVRRQLGGDSTTWAAGSGQLRLRGESWTGYGAGMIPTGKLDDTYGVSRLLLRGEAHLKGRLTLFGELKSSLVTSRDLPGGTRTADQDVLDVQQLYAEVGGRRGALRAGRFDMTLGRERLVSPLDWSNTKRTFQGAQLRARGARAELTAFWVRPVMVRKQQPNYADTLRQFYGIQLARSTPQLSGEVYWLRLEARGAFNGTTGLERRHTVGAHLARRAQPGRFDADVEAAWQTGRVGAGKVSAWMFASQVGRSLAGAWAPRVYVGFDAASGDKALGGDVQTFNQLFPLGHAYFGYIDLQGRQNVLDGSVGVSLKPRRTLTTLLDLHSFRRASAGDALYDASGAVVRTSGTGLPLAVGTEIDLTARQALFANRLILQGGASRYVAGSFLKAAGPARDITWFYLQAAVNF